jgi:hypothetical protein
VVLAGALLATAQAMAQAPAQAPIPKEGGVDWTLCFGGQVHAVSATPQQSFGTYAVTGVARAATGLATVMSMECVGTFEASGRASQSRGYCVYQDAGGDRIHGVDTRTSQGYVWEFRGGTGKFEGVSGSGTVDFLGQLPPIRPGTMQACRRVVGTYRLP